MQADGLVRLRLRSKYHVVTVADEGTFLLSETDSHVLEGNALKHIIPLLESGTLTANEIVETVQSHVSADDAWLALQVLRDAGHLEEAEPSAPPEFAAYWSEFGMGVGSAQSALAANPFEWSAHGDVAPNGLLQSASAFGLSPGFPPKVHLAVTDDYLRPSLFELNRACLARGLPLLLIKPVGIRAWIGPLIIPGQTACWRCLENRLRGNREVEAYIERRTGKPLPIAVPRARVPLFEHHAYSIAVTQLVRFFLTGVPGTLGSQVLITDLTAMSFDRHLVVRRPQCPDCGNPNLGTRAGLPYEIASHRALDSSTSGLRSLEPDEVFKRYQHHISPVTGVVREVIPSLWHGEGPLRVYMAGHNFALKNDQLFFLKDGLRTNSSGKGRTDAQARTSALCEALERYSGVFRGEESRIRASFRDLGADAVDPRSCMLFSDRQYSERDQWLARNSRFQIVPMPFDEDRAIEWSPVWSLTNKTVRYLPTSYLYYNYPLEDDEFYCWADSNGAAAGATFEEAVLQGLLELIERDAVALWWYTRARRPGVDLASFGDPYFEEVRSFYRGHKREYWVLDLTTDTGIPSFVSISRRLGGPTEDVMLGFGSHIDAHAAAVRAVTEMNQFMPAVLTIDHDGKTVYGIHDPEALSWWQTATVKREPYLVADPDQKKRTPRDYRSSPKSSSRNDDIGEILRALVAKLEGMGHEVLVLDQTRLDVGLPVCRVFVPGLRHFWARFAPGRLYDVPVRLGWVSEPVPEEQLNPIPMFL